MYMNDLYVYEFFVLYVYVSLNLYSFTSSCSTFYSYQTPLYIYSMNDATVKKGFWVRKKINMYKHNPYEIEKNSFDG